MGTRGNIDTSTEIHQRHSSLKVSYYQHAVIIDCGADWLKSVSEWSADAILVTHAHPDHSFGFREGAPCPVYATEKSWVAMGDFTIELRQIMPERKEIKIPEGASCTSFDACTCSRLPDTSRQGDILLCARCSLDREAAMQKIKRYIGDVTTLKRSMVRKPGDTIIGHVPIQTQITWCPKIGFKKAIFTQLGSQIVVGDEQKS